MSVSPGPSSAPITIIDAASPSTRPTTTTAAAATAVADLSDDHTVHADHHHVGSKVAVSPPSSATSSEAATEDDVPSTATVRRSNKDARHLLARVKEEPHDDDIKDYAETTMKELLGWYGYDQAVGSPSYCPDVTNNNNNNNPSNTTTGTHLSTQVSNDLDSVPISSTGTTPDSARARTPDPARCTTSPFGSAEGPNTRPASAPGASGKNEFAGYHNNLVNALKNGKPLAERPLEGSGRHVMCAWCQKPGAKVFTVKTGTAGKAFCSEVCFTQCRRASFKKNKICDWCKHVRHTVNFVDFQDGDQQLQFCSEKCLNQYKMNIFCKETQEHLEHIQAQMDAGIIRKESPSKQILITPDLWMKESTPNSTERKRKSSGSASSSSVATEGAISVVEKQDKAHNTTTSGSLNRAGADEHTTGERGLSKAHTPSATSLQEEQHRIVIEPIAEDNIRMSYPSGLTKPSLTEQGARQARLAAMQSVKSGDSVSNSPLSLSTSPMSSDFSSPPSSASNHVPPQLGGALSGSLPPGSLLPRFHPLMYQPFLSPGMPTAIPPFGPPALGQMMPQVPPPQVSPGGSTTPAHQQKSPPSSQTGPSSSTPVQNPAHGLPRLPNPNLPLFSGMPGGMFPPGFPYPSLMSAYGGALLPQMSQGMGGLPPSTLMVPYPFPIPIPLPVPIPIPVPVKGGVDLAKLISKTSAPHDKGTPAGTARKTTEDSCGNRSRCAGSPASESGSCFRNTRELDAQVDDRSRATPTVKEENSGGSESSRSDMDGSCQIRCACCQTESKSDAGPTCSAAAAAVISPKIAHKSRSVEIKHHQAPYLNENSLNGSSLDGENEVMDLSTDRSKSERESRFKDRTERRGSLNFDHQKNAPLPPSALPLVLKPASASTTTNSLSPHQHHMAAASLASATDTPYSARRSRILDAPSIPKDKRSPTPEKRHYFGSVPRDVLYGKRRCMRPRIRSK